MNRVSACRKAMVIALSLCFIFISLGVVFALRERTDRKGIEAKEFRNEVLYISQDTIPIEQVINQLPNQAVWKNFLEQHKAVYAYIDPRSGRPSSVVASIPFIPGTGTNNRVTMESVSSSLGYKVTKITEAEIKHLVLKLLGENDELLNIAMNEIGEVRVGKSADYLWHVYITRQVQRIPVRDANITLTINHGNLVLYGVEKWGDSANGLSPAITKEAALHAGFELIGGQQVTDVFVVLPHLEIIPVAPVWDGTIGKGYGHALVWAFTFHRTGFSNRWEMLVDAQKGILLSFQDTNQYVRKKIVGAVYPFTNDECCPEGCAVSSSPMPFTDTGFAAPDNFTSLNGLYEYTSGTAKTTLTGVYTDISDYCGTMNNETSGTGDIDLGGTNGQHDCIVPSGHSAGDTFAARTASNELSWINRVAASWSAYVPSSPIALNMNINAPCNAYIEWGIYFYRSGYGCRNFGEISTILDHEWGHYLDYNDPSGWTNPGESFADLVANLRSHNSCMAKGVWWTYNWNCGQWTCPTNPSSTGYNCSGYGDCCSNCTGVRESDYAKHASGNPRTPANSTCIFCGAGSSPCAKEVHCEGVVVNEAVWDLASRDLQTDPFTMDKQTAFEVASRLLYIGGAGVTTWYTCNCTAGTSAGCGANSGYMQFITADDDDGNISNGTPHMTAIKGAFDRHGIACATPAPYNSGCLSGPTAAPVLTAEPVANGVELNWVGVPNAVNYYVFKSTGIMGCDYGKAKIAVTSGTTYTDEAMDCFANHYMVLPVGATTACLGPTSNCVSVTSPYPAPVNVLATATAPNQVRVSWSMVPGAMGYNVFRRSVMCGSQIEEKIASNISETFYYDNTVSGNFTYYYSVSTIGSLCESSKSNWVQVVPTGECRLSPCFNGAVNVVETADCALTVQWVPGTSGCTGSPILKYTIYRSTDPAFVPSSSNMIASCLTGTSYTDYAVDYGTTYYYIVRAEDLRTGGPGPCNGGNTDNNIIRKNGIATGPSTVLFSDGFESGVGNWTISTRWQQSSTYAHSGTYSLWSQDPVNLQCATCTETNAVAIPSGAIFPAFSFWTRYAIESGYDAGIIQGSSNGITWIKLTPTPAYPGNTNTAAQACLGTYPQPAFTGANSTWTRYRVDLSSFAGGSFQARFTYATDASVSNGGWYIDDVLIDHGSSCTNSSSAPGTVPDNNEYAGQPLLLIKSGNDLQLNWGVPGGTCITADYGVYRGSLPWIGYDHTAYTCSTGGSNSVTIASDSGNYYYLVVAQNDGKEGSYGKDTSGTERPPSAIPCLPQQIGHCN